MFHIPAHKNVAAPAAQFSDWAEGHAKTLWMNVYRSGWFHREGKPHNLDRHAGDFYETREAAVADIDPPSHYLCTVPFTYTDPEDVRANPAQSIPTPLSVSRRMDAAIREACAQSRPFSRIR